MLHGDDSVLYCRLIKRPKSVCLQPFLHLSPFLFTSDSPTAMKFLRVPRRSLWTLSMVRSFLNPSIPHLRVLLTASGPSPELMQLTPSYLKAITNPSDTTFPRLECSQTAPKRYDYLRSHKTMFSKSTVLPKYFFALDLRQCVKLLPRLLGTILETIRFLGPENCALSIVEGSSTDGTYEVLLAARNTFAKAGIRYILRHSDLATNNEHRISRLAMLRNLALEPLVQNPQQYNSTTTVLFINDIAMCMEDVLELIHQKVLQKADMTCGMDWTYLSPAPSFYDVWIARTMTGETFFEIGKDGNWSASQNLFWSDAAALQRYNAHKPFQVFSCWNGMTAFTAQPLFDGEVEFRANNKSECFQGEPQLFF